MTLTKYQSDRKRHTLCCDVPCGLRRPDLEYNRVMDRLDSPYTDRTPLVVRVIRPSLETPPSPRDVLSETALTRHGSPPIVPCCDQRASYRPRLTYTGAALFELLDRLFPAHHEKPSQFCQRLVCFPANRQSLDIIRIRLAFRPGAPSLHDRRPSPSTQIVYMSLAASLYCRCLC
jgi:hypothetical protein